VTRSVLTAINWPHNASPAEDIARQEHIESGHNARQVQA
jgi:hypothetical protein